MGAPAMGLGLPRCEDEYVPPSGWLHERAGDRLMDVFPRAHVRWALQERRLRVAYQPILRADDLQIIGHEALARMLTQQGSVLDAEAFIDVASEIGLEPRIDADITSQVMSAATRPGPFAASHGKLFLNCSSAFLLQPSCVEQLLDHHRHWLEAWPGAPKDSTPWVLEITERHLDTDPSRLQSNLAPLLDLGFELALDDFGSNHSAFPYLLELPIRYLKFDKALVQAAADNQRGAQILRRLHDMAEDLGIIGIAEGIERKEQLDKVRAIGIVWCQGYLWGQARGLLDMPAG